VVSGRRGKGNDLLNLRRTEIIVFNTCLPRNPVFVSAATLGTLLFVSVVISRGRHLRVDGVSGARIAGFAAVCLAVQTAHFSEEWATGFAERYPALFGLDPLPDAYFLGVNIAFIAVWIIAVSALWKGRPLWNFSLWFLGLAALVNLFFHPAVSLAVGGYFPGLYTSIPLGISGIVLLQKLRRFTTEA